MTTLQPVSLPVLGQSQALASTWARLRPIGRYLLWILALFFVVVVAVVVRLDVAQLEMNLDRNDRAQRAASVLNERLELELRSRRRLQAVQGYAAQLKAQAEVPIVRVEASR